MDALQTSGGYAVGWFRACRQRGSENRGGACAGRKGKRRVDVGTMARLDEKQAESQVSARQADLFGARGLLVAQEYQLKNLLSDNFTAPDERKRVPCLLAQIKIQH